MHQSPLLGSAAEMHQSPLLESVAQMHQSPLLESAAQPHQSVAEMVVRPGLRDLSWQQVSGTSDASEIWYAAFFLFPLYSSLFFLLPLVSHAFPLKRRHQGWLLWYDPGHISSSLLRCFHGPTMSRISALFFVCGPPDILRLCDHHTREEVAYTAVVTLGTKEARADILRGHVFFHFDW